MTQINTTLASRVEITPHFRAILNEYIRSYWHDQHGAGISGFAKHCGISRDRLSGILNGRFRHVNRFTYLSITDALPDIRHAEEARALNVLAALRGIDPVTLARKFYD